MSDIYATLRFSPRKKRCPPEVDDDRIVTPKKLRTAPLTPSSSSRNTTKPTLKQLPTHLSRLYTIQTGLQHALSHALATCAVSPTSDTGVVRNVLNHLSLTTYTGLTTQFDIDDLRRLCWVWEWDGKSLPDAGGKSKLAEDDDNPFLDSPPQSTATDWTRGSMGLVISPTTHYSKVDRKRVPAYGVGIEVEMDIDKDMGGGMAAVARWTAAAESRRREFRHKLECWVDLHSEVTPVPNVPLVDFPQLAAPAKLSSLTRSFASISPKVAFPSISLPDPPASPSTSPSKSPVKRALREFAVPLPVIPSDFESPKKTAVLFPQTPSRHNAPGHPVSPATPRTPVTSITSDSVFDPSTPVRQRGINVSTIPQTPTSSRRQALYERVRHKSLTASPTKALSSEVSGGKLSRDQILKMGQEEMRRRCLLGRLGGIADSVWMLFSNPVTSSSATPTSRKRRALPTSEVVTAVVKSSPVPISSAEANESLLMLARLCPFFLKELCIGGEEWLEMPASNPGSGVEVSPSKKRPIAPPSPEAVKGKHASAEELVTRSPRRIKKEAGGLREVREIIRKELELQD